MADVTMPQLGETVTEGTITRWMKGVGEQVDRDEPLFEVSTDKVDSEVPAPASGVLSEILVGEGETVAVGTRLAVIGDGAPAAGVPATQPAAVPTAEPGVPATQPAAVPTAEPGVPATQPAPAFAPPPPPAPSAPPPTPPSPQAAVSVPPASPAPSAPPPLSVTSRPPSAPVAGPAGVPPPPTGYETAPAVQPGAPTPGPSGEAGAPAPPAAAPQPQPGQTGGADGRLLSPVVRRLLEENGISSSEVTGTGLGGRITREDVLALLDARRAGGAGVPSSPSAAPAPGPPAEAGVPAPPPAATSVPTAPTAPVAPVAPAGASIAAASTATPAVMRPPADRIVPFSNMRRRTAEHMVRSKSTSPHAFIAYEADFESVEKVRRSWNERFSGEEGFSLTYLPFIARAAVEGLREYPSLNASVVDDALVLHQQVNLGVAVDLHHEGLIVPVVHRAEEVTLRGIARRIRDLADRARSRQLTADDIAGGTFSVTNDGPYGTYFTVPIINQPQVAILATDGIRRRPVVVNLPDGSESLAIHSVGVLGMSWDHRAVDGAYVSSYLRKVAEVLATRDWASEL